MTSREETARRGAAITPGRAWLAVIAVAVVYLFTPGRVVLDGAWDVVSAGWFWSALTFLVAGYLAFIVLRWLARVAAALLVAGRGTTALAREVHERVRTRRALRRQEEDERGSFERTLSDIRELGEAAPAEREKRK